MGFADKAIVHHANNYRPGSLIEGLRAYGRDECRQAATTVGASGRSCSAWDERAACNATSARALLLTLLRGGPAIALRRPSKTVALVGRIPMLLPTALVGVRWRLWLSWARILRARLQLALSKGRPEIYYRLYVRIWREAIHNGGLTFLHEHSPTPAYTAGVVPRTTLANNA